MAFTIPNKAVTYPFQSRWFQCDVDILQGAAGGRNGVIASGCAVTASAIPAMTVEVGSGQVVIDGVRYDVSGQTVAIPDADVLLPRFDLIAIGTDGVADAIVGAVDPAPFPLSPPSATVGIAQVFVPAADTAISNEQVVDKRIFVNDPTTATTWTRLSATTDLARTNSGVMTFDPVLAFNALANVTYRVRGALAWRIAVGTPAATLSRGIGGPVSPTFYRGTVVAASVNVGLSTSNNYNTFYQQANGSTSVEGLAFDYFHYILQNGSTAGSTGVRWGQATAVATAVSRLAGSYLEYEVV